MKGSTHKKTGVLLSLLVLLSGCNAINSHQVFSERQSDIEIPTSWQSADTYVNSEFSNQLLALVEQEPVAQLVDQALAANYDLRRTAIRLEEARLLQYQAGINDRPAVNAKFEGQRSKQGQTTSQQTLSLDMSWELDVWGRLADANSAAIANTQASKLDYQSARNSLAARVIQAWLDISYRAKIIDVEKQWIANLISTEEIIKEQVIDGTKEQADLDAARAATAKVRASLESRIHSQSRALRSLNVLRGQTGTNIDGVPAVLPQISAPTSTTVRRANRLTSRLDRRLSKNCCGRQEYGGGLQRTVTEIYADSIDQSLWHEYESVTGKLIGLEFDRRDHRAVVRQGGKAKKQCRNCRAKSRK